MLMFFKILLPTLLLVLCLASCGRAQPLPQRLKTGHTPLDDKLARLVSADEKAISAREARALASPLFLDARAAEEFAVSHLPGARRIGYQQVDMSVTEDIDHTRPVVVYCTVGYRSEKIAQRLRKAGFSAVYNLYGSLYAWKLAGFPLEDANGKPTQKLHTYNRKWGDLVPDSIGEKVWE